MSEPDRPPSGELRWQSFVRHSREPLFLLNRQRRLLFANEAWEQCTGLKLSAVRGQPCRMRRDRTRDPQEATLAALAPPDEAVAGQTCRARRRAPGSSASWWQLDFFPFHGPDGLLGILGKITPLPTQATAASPLPDRLMALRDRHAEAFRLDALSSDVPAMQRVIEQARLAASGRMPVTLVGELGTGKRWLARAVHQASAVRDRCFAAVDCRALPQLLITDLLLDARGRRLALGTIYLREPAEMPRELQDQIAGLAQASDRTEMPRLIFGHTSDPADLVRAGRLSAGLHAAAGTLTIPLPPLRERLADLDALIGVVLDHARLLTEAKAMSVSPDAVLTLRSHAWPGNLRELSTALGAASHHAKGERIELADLPFYLRQAPLPAEKKLPLDALLEQAERRLIGLALKHAKGNRARTAEILGIWRPRLIRRLEHFGLGAREQDR